MIPPSSPDKPPLESAKRSIVVDMSPAAIDRRMRELAALWDFWKYLRNFRLADHQPGAQATGPPANETPSLALRAGETPK
jgi:hypothetical protein